MVEKKHLLKLGLISVAALVVGAVIGLVLNYQTIKEVREEPSTPVPSDQVEEEKPEEKIATYSGKIKPSLQPEIAAHYLEDENGQTIIFLKSGKIESGFLEVLEGQAVEVMGRVAQTDESGPEVLEVDEVHL